MQYDVIHCKGYSLIKKGAFEDYVGGKISSDNVVDLGMDYVFIRGDRQVTIDDMFEEALRLGLMGYITGDGMPGTTFSAIVAGYKAWGEKGKGNLESMEDVLYGD